MFQVTPPTIALRSNSYRSSADTFALEGTVTDDVHVEDVYVFVSNAGAKVETRKVFYRSNRGGKVGSSIDFAATIPLWDGSNVVTVVARESSEVRTMQTLVIYKDPGVVAEAPAASRAIPTPTGTAPPRPTPAATVK